MALPPHHSTAEGGGGCLTSATAQPWQAQDGRCRPKPCGVCSALWHNFEHSQALFKVVPASLHKAFAGSWAGDSAAAPEHDHTS